MKPVRAPVRLSLGNGDSGMLTIGSIKGKIFFSRNQKHEGQGNRKYCQGSMCDVTELWDLLRGREKGVKTILEHHDLDVLTELRNDLRQEDLSRQAEEEAGQREWSATAPLNLRMARKVNARMARRVRPSSCALMGGWRRCSEQFRWEPEQPQATALCEWRQSWRSRSFPGKKSSPWQKQKPQSRGTRVLDPQYRS